MQAARGASLSPGSGDPEPSVPSSRRRLRVVFALIALTLYAIDQVSKQLAVTRLDGEGRIPLVGDLFGLRLAFNPGAAFSLGTDFTVVISIVAIVATVAILALSRRIGSPLWAVAMGVLLAGVTGNLTDRILRDPAPFHGHVVDMFELPNFPIFNVADVCINVAAVLIVVQAFRGIRLDGTRDEDHVVDDDAQDDAQDEARGTAEDDADADEVGRERGA